MTDQMYGVSHYSGYSGKQGCWTAYHIIDRYGIKRGCKDEEGTTHRSLSPIHLLTKSADDTLKKVDFASVATAFAKKLLPVPGGP